MTRAERRAMEYTAWEKNQSYRDFLEGYKKAKKDTIKMAISWIKKNTGMNEYEREVMRMFLED